MAREVARETEALSAASATGNRFRMWDGFVAKPPADPANEAMRLCEGRASDGLLLVLPVPSNDADCQMVLYNADGGRAETCGNGLRCVGKLMFEAGRLEGRVARVQTDVGVVRVEVASSGEAQKVTSARVEFALPRELRAIELDAFASENSPNTRIKTLQGTFVDLGNPHCVLFGESSLTDRVGALGPILEHHEHFPQRANIEFATLDPARANRFLVRVWERGVGETKACGSGACAVAVAAVRSELASWPVAVRMPGGLLTVDCASGRLWLSGPVDQL